MQKCIRAGLKNKMGKIIKSVEDKKGEYIFLLQIRKFLRMKKSDKFGILTSRISA